MPAGSEQLGFGSEAATTVVERDGSFTFLNVPAGEYTLLAQAVFGEFTSGNGEVALPDAPGSQPMSGRRVWAAWPAGTRLLEPYRQGEDVGPRQRARRRE